MLLLTKFRIIKSIIITLTLILILASAVHAAPNQNSAYAEINQKIQIYHGGLTIINETITVMNSADMRELLLGFPLEFKENLDYVLVCDENGKVLSSNYVELGDYDFYGFKIKLPEEAKENKTIYVSCVFSGLIEATAENNFAFKFPANPMLSIPISKCITEITLPEGAEYDKIDEKLNATTSGLKAIYALESLESFESEIANLTFTSDILVLIECEELKRTITLMNYGWVRFSDTYRIKYYGKREIYVLWIPLPVNASNLIAKDFIGKLSAVLNKPGGKAYASVTVRSPLSEGEETVFTLTYDVPWKVCVKETKPGVFVFSPPETEVLNATIKKVAIKVVLPEGAKIESTSFKKETLGFQAFRTETSITLSNLTPLNTCDIEVTYRYSLFWSPFRPTLWVCIASLIACILSLVFRAPAPPTPVIPVPPEMIREFIDSYERKRAIIRELKALEEEVRRGRISRGRYKSRRRALESSLAKLSKKISQIARELKNAGGVYAEAVENIEIAEAEIEATEASIGRLKARYRRREISSDTYRRLLSDYEHKIDKANITIEESLLRLKEEVS